MRQDPAGPKNTRASRRVRVALFGPSIQVPRLFDRPTSLILSVGTSTFYSGIEGTGTPLSGASSRTCWEMSRALSLVCLPNFGCSEEEKGSDRVFLCHNGYIECP